MLPEIIAHYRVLGKLGAGKFALSLEQPDQMLGYHNVRLRYGFSADYWDT